MTVRIMADVSLEFEVETDDSDKAEDKVRALLDALELEDQKECDYQIVLVQEM